MSNECLDRIIIRGGFIVVAGLGLAGSMTGMVGIAGGQTGALLGGAMLLPTASLVGAACLLAVNFPNRRHSKWRRHRGDT